MSEQRERMKVASDALLACPFCGNRPRPTNWIGLRYPYILRHKPTCYLREVLGIKHTTFANPALNRASGQSNRSDALWNRRANSRICGSEGA